MKFRVETKYALTDSDVDALIAAGQEKKKYWSFKNLSDNVWMKYGEKWQIATSPFNAVLDLEEGKEYQISAGHWDVTNGGRHANQRRCCYVYQGQLYYCNYRELPSQGGVPGTSTSAPVGPFTGGSSIAPAAAPSAPAKEYVVLPQKRCEFDGSIKTKVEEDCPLCEPIDPSKGDNCRNCQMCQDIFVEKRASR